MPRYVEFEGKLIDVDVTLRELDRWDCEESLSHFLRTFWKYIDPAPFIDGWIIDAICDHLQAVVDGEIRHLIINIPPRSLKSTLCSVAFPAWVWSQRFVSHTSGPGVKFLYASYADRLSLRDSVRCRRIIESPLYQTLWAERFKLSGDQNAKHRFSNDKGGERLITSIGAGVTGEGGDCWSAGTQVTTPSGPRNIEDIRAGDAVLAFDHSLGKVVISRVTATRERSANDLCEIHEISGRSGTCTKDHRLFSPGRGYIRADQLGIGDGLLVCEPWCWPAEAASSFDLRQVRERNHQAVIQCPEGIEARKPRRLLQQSLFSGASCSEERKHGGVQALWQAAKLAASTILRRHMQARLHRCQSARPLSQGLRAMRSRVFLKGEILLARLCGCCTFSSDGWCSQFQVPGQSGIWPIPSRDGANNPGARRISMRGLWTSRQEGEDGQARGFDSPHASFGRKSRAQCAGESTDAMRGMPHEAPRWSSSTVSHVRRYSGEPVSVYDIQVEEQNNFFANGILAHNCIIIDDPNAANEIESEATTESTLEWWHGTASTRLNDPKQSAFIVIQQRLAQNDLTGDILEKNVGDWTHVMIPMHYDSERSFVTNIGWKDPREIDGELAWPERFDAKSVKELEANLGPWRSSGQLEQNPIPKGGGIIKREWWLKWEGKEHPGFSYILATADLAYTEKTENDYSAITVWGVFAEDTVGTFPSQGFRGEAKSMQVAIPNPKVFLIDAWHERLPLHELVEKLAKTCISRKVDKLRIENKGPGISVSQEMRRLFNNEGFAIECFDPGNQDKMARLYSIQHIFAEGMVYAPDKDYVEPVIQEAEIFPKGKHDDLVDTVSASLKYLRDLGLLQRAPEVRSDIEHEMRHETQRTPAKLYPG